MRGIGEGGRRKQQRTTRRRTVRRPQALGVSYRARMSSEAIQSLRTGKACDHLKLDGDAVLIKYLDKNNSEF